jgi:hypothetical protein
MSGGCSLLGVSFGSGVHIADHTATQVAGKNSTIDGKSAKSSGQARTLGTCAQEMLPEKSHGHRNKKKVLSNDSPTLRKSILVVEPCSSNNNSHTTLMTKTCLLGVGQSPTDFDEVVGALPTGHNGQEQIESMSKMSY